MNTIVNQAFVNFDNTRALAEGWDLFDVEGRLQLQRIDDPSAELSLGYDQPKFDTDADAIIHVAKQADAGSAYHREALYLIGSLAE